jgi:glycine C-acetyltransferase
MLNKAEPFFVSALEDMEHSGRRKGKENIVVGVKRPEDGKGPRYLVRGKEGQEFIRMNSNSYLGFSLNEELLVAEETASRAYGVGPGAVRFISGTYKPHRDLEKKLAAFHGREEAMVFSSAYSTVVSILPSLVTAETAVISDELNHNCIINAVRLSRPKDKAVYKHLDMAELEGCIISFIEQSRRLIVVTDGVFSMRGDYAPLKAIANVAQKYDVHFPEGILVVVDDSHGVGAFGETGRGTEEFTGGRADILIGTLGKAFGVNGGYAVSSDAAITYLRETAPMYIYSNPITPGEAAAALRALEILESQEGKRILAHLRAITKRFRSAVSSLGYEVIEGDHPIVPIMIRDTNKTAELISFLAERGILATGMNYPVVPKGDEEVRFQVNADHTEGDIDYVIEALREYRRKGG